VDRRGGFGRWGGSRNKGQKKENENGNGGGERWGRQRSEVSGGRWRRVAGKRGRGVCAASPRVGRGMLSGGQRYGQRGEWHRRPGRRARRSCGHATSCRCRIAWRLSHKPVTVPVRRSVMGRPTLGAPRTPGRWDEILARATNRGTSPTSQVPKLFGPFVRQPPWEGEVSAGPRMRIAPQGRRERVRGAAPTPPLATPSEQISRAGTGPATEPSHRSRR
jgi:hypothetical protein